MGSTVIPYFISSHDSFPGSNNNTGLTAEQLQAQNALNRTPPTTPAPSAITDEKGRRTTGKKLLKYKIPKLKRHEPVRKKMELIKEKLEQSRERYKERKQLQEQISALQCEPTVIGLDEHGDIPKLDRSVSDLGPNLSSRYPTKRADGSFPYVYFVVAQDTIAESGDFAEESDENSQIAKSVKVRRKKIFLEQTKRRKEKQAKAAKMQGIARELGLKSSPLNPKPYSEERPVTQPAINHIVFPIEAAPQQTNLRRIHSPPRIPPSTPATVVHTEYQSDDQDPDENVPRKHFISRPLYAGKPKIHSYSRQTFELPLITPEQRKRALGLASSDSFEDSYTPKSSSQNRQRKVTFADSLPVIRGSGFVFGEKDVNRNNDVFQGLGPRAVTMGSITLPSERAAQQEKCQKLHVSDKEAVKFARKIGIPLALPKIDIVSNVYDEMIIKMVRDYLQDSNTPSRQAQLARDLLIQLQQNDTVKQMQRLQDLQDEQEAITAQTMEEAKQKKLSKKMSTPNENSVESENTNEEAKHQVVVKGMPTFEEIHNNKPKTPSTPVARARNTPLVKITFKTSAGVTEVDALEEDKTEDDDKLKAVNPPKSSDSIKSITSPKLPRSTVIPTSFKMPPPGLSREATNLSISLNS